MINMKIVSVSMCYKMLISYDQRVKQKRSQFRAQRLSFGSLVAHTLRSVTNLCVCGTLNEPIDKCLVPTGSFSAAVSGVDAELGEGLACAR